MSIYLGASVYGTALTDLLNNNNTWVVQNGTLTEISGEGCYQLKASSTNTCYSYKNLNAPVPPSGIGTAGNTQYLYARAKVWSNTSNTGYPLFSDYAYTSSGTSSGTAGRITQSYIVGETTAIDATFPKGRWCTISCIIPTYLGSTGYREAAVGVQMYGNAKNDYIKFKDLFCVEVTSLFNGVPTRQECDKKISFYNNNVYLENDNGTITILNNKLITDIYIGNSNNTTKRVVSGYIGDINNTPNLFYSYSPIKTLLADMTKVYDISISSGTSGNVSITNTDYKSDLYYLFAFYTYYWNVFKIKNGTISSTNIKTSNTYATIHTTTGWFTPGSWDLSTNGGTSAANVWGGTLMLVRFPNFQEEEVDNLLDNLVVYTYNGRDSSIDNISTNLIADLYHSSLGKYIITVHGHGGSSSSASANSTYFTIWDTNYKKIYPYLNISSNSQPYYGATITTDSSTGNQILNLGRVNGSVLVFKECFNFKKFKLYINQNNILEYSYPANESWYWFTYSNKNPNGVFYFSGSTSTSILHYSYNSSIYNVQYNGVNVTRGAAGSLTLIEEFTGSNYYTLN